MKMLEANIPVGTAVSVFNERVPQDIANEVANIVLTFTPKGCDFETERQIDNLTLETTTALIQKRAQVNILSNNLSEEKTKTHLLKSLSLTQSFITKENSKDFLPQDVLNKMGDGVYYVTYSSHGYAIKESLAPPNEAIPLPVEDITLSKLAKLTNTVMEPHFQYGHFYSNGLASAEQIETILKTNIKTTECIIASEKELSLADAVLSNNAVTNTYTPDDSDSPEFDNNAPDVDDNSDIGH
jgi:hypothetical protein